MKLAFATTFDARDIRNWSGTPYYMSQTLEAMGASIDYIGDLTRCLPPFFKCKQVFSKWTAGQRVSPRFNIHVAQHYSLQVAKQLKNLSVDAIIAPQINPICYLDIKQPIVLWTDGLYASLLGFYPGFSEHSAETIRQGNAITTACLSRTHLAIFSSDWAARTAIEIYGVPQEKVKVVPFGANLICNHTYEEMRTIIQNRSRTTVKLLFLGKHWHRKGGDIVFRVARALHERGQSVELNFVGCSPPKEVVIPDYIKCHGFISKRSTEGVKKLNDLFYESHFLFVPSRAEAYGIVFCEANAFGLPCLTSYVGGISTVVKNHINGMTFSLASSPLQYADYIIDLMQDEGRYEDLALSSFNEFVTRLNWKSAVKTVRGFLR
ncbi:MAG: hypothetical protein A3F43_01465 [Gammaproteobacteria bacterium RIFCSPHIGHO2_12_FULL_42_10]|nr:MAG: hypothetical protein A3F43_01465 [Gammaproteobacteria bacterium RIFCSPHIGHO2_12_FULL_42_10]